MKADRAAEDPIYRSYLAGGPEAFRLTRHSSLVVVGLSLLIAVLGMTWQPIAAAQVASLGSVAAGALVVACIAARWLGARRGLLAGLAMGASQWSLQATGGDPLDRLLDLSIWVGLAAFALANVPGRLAVVDRPWTRAGFWVALAATCSLTGGVGPAYLLTICILYLMVAQDTRGLRFLLDVRGLAFIAAVIGCLVTFRHFSPALVEAATAPALGELLVGPAMAGLPWTPLALLGLFVVFREGYCFLPFWQLLGAWALAPVGLLAVGLFWPSPHLSAMLPPLAVLAAVGFDEGLHRLRRLGSLRRRRATA